MGRPKGSKNKPRGKAEVKAKAKAKPLQKAEPPDWLRKAMQPTKTPQKRGPKPKALKEKFQQQAKAKRGKKPMANKPHYDPLDDPDLRADTKGDLPPPESPIKPPEGIKPIDPGYGNSPNRPSGSRPDQSLPGNPIKPGKPAPLPGGGVRPDNALPDEEEPEAKYDEVAAGEAIPPENAQALIAGTMGGGGDHHAMAKRILERMANEANWVINKGADDTPAGKAIKARKEAQAKAKKEAEDRDAKDAKDAKARKDKDEADAKRKA